jgi:ATP-dependent DNA helicase RecQ
LTNSIHEILKQYWGYDEFRPLQQDIIESIIQGKDTLALLPTGGGKSICFQVPGMYLEGVCIVVSPLIALMKDQVENLEKVGIRAHAIYSGLHYQEIQLILNNCVHGGVKFLYVSPERLGSQLLLDYLGQMKIGLFAIDEAHCISQWGFDFRPEYRKISEIRKLHPNVPLIALTATATASVVDDIQTQLNFKSKNLFRKSFERLNLHYIVRTNENKEEKLLNSVKNIKGSGLVYVRNRKMTEQLSNFLVANSVNASFYHAGLSAELRISRQEDWIKNKTRVMVCTNAFGMGIDKPDCNFVVHYEMPDCLEAYYQEAGRAGRNGNPAYCLLIFHPSDSIKMRNKLEQSFPEDAIIRKVYDGLGSFFKLPIGGRMEEEIDFDYQVFSKYIHLHPILVINSIKLLSQLGILTISEALNQLSQLQIILPGNQLYAFQVEHEKYDIFLKTILRTYGGIFDKPISISEKLLAMKMNLSETIIKQNLEKLHLMEVLHYKPQKTHGQLQIIEERVSSNYLNINPSFLESRRNTEREKLEAMIRFAENDKICRSRVLLAYFDENSANDCGVCDICKEKLKGIWEEENLSQLVNQIEKLNWENSIELKDLVKQVKGFKEEDLLIAFRILLDKGILQLDKEQRLVWKKGNQ